MPAPFPSPEDFRDRLREMMPDLPDVNEPGFASTFTPSTATQEALWKYSPLVPIGATAAGLWYLNAARQKKKKKQQPDQAPVVLAKAAAIDLQKIVDNIRWHLPKLRVPDTAVGMAGGAGAGALYDLIRGKGEDGKRKTLKRVLTGALAGAGLSNVAGDRFRRYISNTKLPLGYTPNAAKEIKPSLKRIWNAAILDKPDYDPQTLEYWRSKPGGSMLPFLPARQEIVRRQFGLPFAQENNSEWWQKNPEGYYSLNEKSPDYAKRLSLLFGSASPRGIRRNNQLHSGPDKVLQDPEKALAAFSKYPDRQPAEYDFFGSAQLFGGMQLPHVKNPDGSYSGMALDRWDVTPNKKETQYFKDNWLKMLTDSKWRQAPLKENLSWYIKPDSLGHTNASTMKALGGRMVWDNVLSDELPWIGQKFTLQPRNTPRTWGEYLGNSGSTHGLQFLKADNTPATPAMDFQALDAWDKKK